MLVGMTESSLSMDRVRDLVMSNRAIRSPGYRADRTGIAWGADVIPALLSLTRLDVDPRPDRPQRWVAVAALPQGYEPEFAKDWQGHAFRLELGVFPGPTKAEDVLVVHGLSTLVGEDASEDMVLGRVDLSGRAPSASSWREQADLYQAARRSDDDHQPYAVAAFIDALPGWKHDVANRIDQIIDREVPHARRGVKWHAPFYGVEGQGWFASISPLSKALKLTFTRGTSLDPRPPGGKRDDSRWLDLGSLEELDEEQIASWVRQAAKLPGWGG